MDNYPEGYIKMFKKILVIFSERLSGKHIKLIENVKNLIKCDYAVVNSNELKESDFSADLVITIGGDGTFIRAANFLKNQLILGINAEPELSEGALTSLKDNELEKLREILQGDYNIKQMQRIQLKLDNGVINRLAVNEVYVGTAMQFHSSRYIIKLKGAEEEQRSSGVIITTGSGSNAWYKSAGGKPFNCDCDKIAFLVREPYTGDRLFKPKILAGEINKGEKIEFKSTRKDGGIITIDNIVYDFNKPSVAEVSISDTPLNVIVK